MPTMFAQLYGFLLLSALPFSVSSAVPYPTTFTNSTYAGPSVPSGGGGCPTQCTHDLKVIKTISWQKQSISATVTAETLVLVVNKKANSTKTRTITNSEVELADYTPAAVNDAGTRTTTFLVTTNDAVRTHTVAFPTIYYADYPSSYTICGTLPTTVNGAPTCIKHPCGENPTQEDFFQGAPSFAYPTHSAIPEALQTIKLSEPDVGQGPPVSYGTLQPIKPEPSQLATDPQGLTFKAVWTSNGADVQDKLQVMMPELSLWECHRLPILRQEPNAIKEIALYVTATSISTELDEVNTASLSQSLKPISNAASTKSAATTGPSAKGDEGISQPTARPPTIVRAGSRTSDVEATSTVLGSNTMSPVADSQAVIIGQTHTPGSTAELKSDASATPAVLQTSNGPELFTTGSMTASPAASPTQVLPLTVGNEVMTADADDKHIAGTQTLAPGVPITIGSGTATMPVFFQITDSNTILVVGSTTSTLANSTPEAAALTIGTQILTADANNHYVAGTQTLAPSMPSIIGSGTGAPSISLQIADSNTILVVGSSTSTLANPTHEAAAALTIGTQPLTANSNDHYIIGTQTLAPGRPITMGSGTAATPVVLQTSNNDAVFVIGSSTSTLLGQATEPHSLAAAGQIVTANSEDQYIAGTQTLAVGVPITVGSGTTAIPVILQTSSSDTFLVIGSSTATLLAPTTTLAQPPTVGSQIVTANSQSQYVVGFQTLTPGGTIVVSDTPISLAPNATQLVVGTSTQRLESVTISGHGPESSTSALGTGAETLTADADRRYRVCGSLAALMTVVTTLRLWL